MQISNGMVPSVKAGAIDIPYSKAMIFEAALSIAGYATLMYNNVAYQVPVGKKLILIGLTSTAATAHNLGAGYGDASVAAAGAPAGAVDAYGNSGPTRWLAVFPGNPVNQWYNFYFQVPATKYPYAYFGGAVAVTATYIGYLENV